MVTSLGNYGIIKISHAGAFSITSVHYLDVLP